MASRRSSVTEDHIKELKDPQVDPNKNANSSFETTTSNQQNVDPTLSRTNNIVLIPQLEVIDKELAYKQRMNRPFKVIQNLPLSVDLPDYSLLDHSLSVKDSATLYNSLIVSRHNWIYNVFRSYWTRREQYINVLNDRKRDKMSKLCDMKLIAGPHTFEIKLFILKDDEKERLHQEEIERKREEKQRRKEEKLKREQELKIKLENQVTQAQVQLQNAENKTADSEIKRDDDKLLQNVDNNDGKRASNDLFKSGDLQKDKDGDITMKEAPPSSKPVSKSADSKPSETADSKSQHPVPQQQQSSSNTNSNLKKRSEVLPNTTKTAIRVAPVPTQSSLSTAGSKVGPLTSSTAKSTLTPTPPPPAQASSSGTANNERGNSDIMSNPENAIMIQNLNSMAKKDEHLSELMRIVASGKATPVQISEFQKYIQKAREMGDVNGIYKKLQEENLLKQENLKKQTELMRIESERAKLEKQRLKEEKEKEKIRVKQEKTELKLKMQEERERLKQMKREEREREREMKRIAKERKREESRRERERERETKRDRKEQEKLEKQQRREERERLKLDREREKEKEKERQKEFQKKLLEEGDDKLTAFQERYATGATLVFEFYENSSARYFIPRNTIFEVIDDEAESENEDNVQDQANETTTLKQEDEDGSKSTASATPNPATRTDKAKKKKRKSPYVDLLCSFVFVHNQSEIDAWEKRQKLKKEEEEAKKREAEEAQKKQQQEEELNESSTGKPATRKRRKKKNAWGTSKRHTRNATAKQQQTEDEEENDEYAPEPDEEDIKPTAFYSTTTIKLTEVPFKFAQLIKNSGNPVPEVQEYMKQIFKEGERLKKFNVWYQLDGVKDELLGETLRFNLNRLDYVNGGGRLKGKAMLKRIVEKSGSEADVNKKRSRR